ncbi:MAG: hypothetical protein MJ137_07590 [Clostridia bacterium]|nr:hypothetical protein [Clostridia bacterium]
MKRISTLLLFVIIASLLASCTNMVKPTDTSDADSISTSDIDNTLVPGETTSSEDTVPVATDKEDNTSVPEGSTVDNITTDAVAVDIDNPKLSDLFDLTKEHFESESLIQSIAVTSEWHELEWKQWQTSFKDAIDLLGKPHGFRPGHPDTLVWVTDTGKTFGIRFYVPQASTESFINTYDQLMHSYAAWCHPVNCDIEFPDESYLINLPIVPQDSSTSDSIGPWQDIFFDLNHENKPADRLLSELNNISTLTLDDLTSFIGKPHGICHLNSSSGLLNQLFWISDTGNIYRIGVSSYFGPNDNLMETIKNSVVVASPKMIQITKDVEWTNNYTIRTITSSKNVSFP